VLPAAAPGFEGEEQEPDVAPMNQPGLPMAALGRMGLSPQCAGKIGKVERHHRP
jgi:hypothetical protein